jgi:hypothetical protein
MIKRCIGELLGDSGHVIFEVIYSRFKDTGKLMNIVSIVPSIAVMIDSTNK